MQMNLGAFVSISKDLKLRGILRMKPKNPLSKNSKKRGKKPLRNSRELFTYPTEE